MLIIVLLYCRLTNLYTLGLSAFDLTDWLQTNPLTGLTALRQLHLKDSIFPDCDAWELPNTLTALEYLPLNQEVDNVHFPSGLQSLSLWSYSPGPRFIDHIVGLNALSRLNLTGDVLDEVYKHTSVCNLVKLTRMGVRDDNFPIIQGLPSMSSLRHLDMMVGGDAPKYADISELSKLTGLESMVYVEPSNAPATNKCFLPPLANLTSLVFYPNMELQDLSIRNIVFIKNLESLELGGQLYDDFSPRPRLEILSSLSRLSDLNVSCSRGLETSDLHFLPQLASLASLNLTNCSDLGTDILAVLKDCTSLTALRLSYNKWFGLEGLSYLHDAGLLNLCTTWIAGTACISMIADFGNPVVEDFAATEIS
jgi:hypothetical protein